MNLSLGHIELFVIDPMTSLPFYRDGLGAEVVAIQSDAFIWLKLGHVELLLRPSANPAPSKSYPESSIGLVLYCDDLETAVYQLKGFGIPCQPIPGEADCYAFQDPDGHWFQLVNPNAH